MKFKTIAIAAADGPEAQKALKNHGPWPEHQQSLVIKSQNRFEHLSIQRLPIRAER